MSSALVPYRPIQHQSLFYRQGQLSALQGTLRRLETEYEEAVEEVRRFERRYRPAVGDRYDELERLRERIARGWESLARVREGRSRDKDVQADGAVRTPSSPKPGGTARQLFLVLARLVHPDLAEDAAEHRRRHEVMAEATLAYRDGDERRLQWLLEHWQAQGDPIPGLGVDSFWSRTNRQIAWVRYRIREMRHALAQLHASPMGRIMREHDRGRARGRNVILEMRREVQAELEAARGELARLERTIDELDPELRRAMQQ